MRRPGAKDRNIKRYKLYAQHRDAQGFTDAYISLHSHVPKSTLSAWKSGEVTPNVDSLTSICKVLGVSLTELIGDV